MARQPTTRLHVSGYRFLVRRMEHALLRGDIGMLHPIRAQSISLVVGCGIAAVVVAVCAVMAFLRPNTPVGDSAIVMSRESGALYVRTDGILHPVANLASARLIVGNAAKPQLVNAAGIDSAKRGSLLGIPGAPDVIGKPLSANESGWAICEDTTTTMIAGRAEQPGNSDAAVLVTARSESAATTYLLYDGRRALVDLRSPGVVWALRLDGIEPRAVSRALLDAVPEAPPIVAPHLPDAGRPGAVPGLTVGTVVRVTRVAGDDFFVVLTDGIQRIGETAANLIRSLHSQGSREILSVSPDTVAGVSLVDSLPVSTYPGRATVPLGARDAGVLCAGWQPDGPKSAVWIEDSQPDSTNSVELAQGDGEGGNLDSVVMPAGRSAYVRAASLGRQRGESGPLYLVTDTGVLFGIRDEETAKMLGVDGDPVAAPWPLLARLPRGPELGRDAALVARDGIAPPS